MNASRESIEGYPVIIRFKTLTNEDVKFTRLMY